MVDLSKPVKFGSFYVVNIYTFNVKNLQLPGNLN